MSVNLSGGDRAPQGADCESPDTNESEPHGIDFIPSLSGLPSGVGYEESFLMPELDAQHVCDLDGAARLIRVLVLRPQQPLKRGALLFSECDLSKVLGIILDTSGAPANDVITSCDYTIGKDGNTVVITLTLVAGTNPGSDRLLAEGIKALFRVAPEGTNVQMPCLRTEAGVMLVSDSYSGGGRALGDVLCRVISHAPHDTIKEAFVSRGVPAADIIQISAKAIGDTGVPGNTVFIRLKPGFPIDRVPWKVPLQEPGFCLAPRKVAIQGHKGCLVCRDLGHSKSACKSAKENLCGRCTFPFDALTKQGRNPHNHDCEGGPAGYGAAFLDPMGEGWHQVWLQHEASRSAPAVSEDPISSRLSDLQAARDLADIARAQLAQQSKKKKKKKKDKRKEHPTPAPGDTPPPQGQPRLEEIPAAPIGNSSIPL
jgi:hypothetical protein